MRSSLIVSLLTVIFLAGCAGGPPPVHPAVPSEVKAKGASAVRSAILDETSHTTVHLDDEREVVYLQSFGNSVAVGALFGPLGVLANIAATKALTESDLARLKGKIPVSASHAFKQASQEMKLQLAEQRAEGGVNFSPYLYLVKLNNDKILLASALVVEAPTPGAIMTHPRYLYQLPMRYSIDELAVASPAMVAEIGQQMQKGYAEMIRFYQNDKPEAVEKERLVKYRSDFLSPRFDFEGAGKIAAQNSERVWIRNIFGVAAVSRANITIVGPWE